MRVITNGKRGLVGLIVAAMLMAPSLVQAKGEYFKEIKEKIRKELKLSPDKNKDMQQVEEKYAKDRKEILDDLKKNQEELKRAMAASKPDEGKIKDLVSTITSLQNKLMDSFKSQRDDELALLTPVQQGKYVLALGEWKHSMEQYPKEKKGKKEKQ